MAAGRRLDVPVVDLASPDPRAAAKSTRQACVEYGFFYVINHGIERALLERVFADSRKSSSSRPWNGGEDGAGEEQQIQGLHLALLREGRRLPRVTSRNSVFLSQQFSQNSVFQPVSAKIQTCERGQ
ncbi:probable flavonol synthase 4 [Miscanthus floridulus]|uniref:probable flavonol synthase 4 isoform X2 n=1 Tax=Miscanthus floridulus TaxID=154761 RepID=UPI003457BBDB